jgi:hypothetical protein
VRLPVVDKDVVAKNACSFGKALGDAFQHSLYGFGVIKIGRQ